jgi:hypothetical protein
VTNVLLPLKDLDLQWKAQQPMAAENRGLQRQAQAARRVAHYWKMACRLRRAQQQAQQQGGGGGGGGGGRDRPQQAAQQVVRALAAAARRTTLEQAPAHDGTEHSSSGSSNVTRRAGAYPEVRARLRPACAACC